MNSTLKACLLLAAVSLGPAIAFSIFDPGFAMFAPFFWLFAFLVSVVFWFFLKVFKLREPTRTIVVMVLLFLWSFYVGIESRHTYTAGGRFERLLIAPAPKSVELIATSGRVGMAGGYELVVFSISPADLEQILKLKDFKSAPLSEVDHELRETCLKDGIEPSFVYKAGDLSYLLLIANKTKDRALLYRFRL